MGCLSVLRPCRSSSLARRAEDKTSVLPLFQAEFTLTYHIRMLLFVAEDSCSRNRNICPSTTCSLAATDPDLHLVDSSFGLSRWRMLWKRSCRSTARSRAARLRLSPQVIRPAVTCVTAPRCKNWLRDTTRVLGDAECSDEETQSWRKRRSLVLSRVPSASAVGTSMGFAQRRLVRVLGSLLHVGFVHDQEQKAAAARSSNLWWK